MQILTHSKSYASFESFSALQLSRFERVRAVRSNQDQNRTVKAFIHINLFMIVSALEFGFDFKYCRLGLDFSLDQGGIIMRILASRMQRSLEPRAKFSAELMKNDANNAKPMRHTRYFERSISSKGLGCGEVKNFMPPCIGHT